MHALLRFSAINNSGNAQYYVGNLEGAQHHYERALELNRNLSSAGNLIAVLILRGQIDDSLALAEETRQWAFDEGKAITEASQFSSILVNGSFAHMMKGNFSSASEFLREAYAMESDNLNALNLAVSTILEGDSTTASIVLKRFKYPVLDLLDQADRVTFDYDPCYYLVRGLMVAEDNAPLAAAHYYTYMKIARTERQLREVTPDEFARVKALAFDHLSKDPTPCSDLALIPALRDRLKLISPNKSVQPTR